MTLRLHPALAYYLLVAPLVPALCTHWCACTFLCSPLSGLVVRLRGGPRWRWPPARTQAQLEEAQRQKQQSYEHMQSELEALRVTYRVAVERSAALENELRLRDMALEKLASKTGS